ncbi:TRAP transporter large permease [Occultella glacieicola]|uniref:TRAP transporter large permease n=1 Tax=Occultella glacieicola TaxID=2518684 RepID=A0ABY2E0K7_9MICO|nr:TRAP transporter large permease [Occultella glacieicola]TDE89490.1 TRAP transporter large permease [Occultella glacieicola]
MVTIAVSLLVIFIVICLLRVPIAYALLLACLPFFFLADRLNSELLVQRMYAGVDSFVLLAVPFFVLAGGIMNAAKVTDRLLALANALVGWVRGGLGMVNVATSMGFGGVSGSSTADVAGLGSILIPQMKRRGYAAGYAVGITAASAVIGTIIPPSIQMVVWGSLTNTSIGAMFLGGVVPGVMIGGGMMLVAYVEARRHDYPREPRMPFKEVAVAFRDSALALVMIVIVLGGIIGGFVTATEASVLAVLYALFLGLVVYRTIKIRDLPKIFRESALLTALPLFALAAAAVFAYLLAFYRIPFIFEDALAGVPSWAILWVVVLIFVVLGTFLDALPAMAIMIPVLAPAVLAAGVDPVQYGVVAVIALAFGLITPPYGLCLLLAAKIGKIPVIQAIKPMAPFGLVIVATMALAILVPDVVLWLPGLGGE